MVTAVYDFPDKKFRSSQWGYMSTDGVFSNGFNGTVQTIDFGGAFWQASFTLTGMKGDSDQFRLWKAFFMQLGGRSGRFYGYDPDKRTPAGTGTGTPLVNGANQTGNMVIIDGATINQATWLKQGDYFQINGEYKCMTADAASDGSGNVTLNFFPQLRSSPPDNDPIVVTNPKCLMMLDSPNLQWQSDSAKLISLSFTAREAFDFTTYLLTEAGDNFITEAGDYLVT